MKKIVYYLSINLFTIYLFITFLLINKLYKTSILSIIYFIINIIYSIFIIIAILSKKDIYKNSLSYNILNIGIYFYTFMLYKITNTNTTLDIINNQTYYNNNYIMISILLIGLTIYTIVLNNEKIWILSDFLYNKKIYKKNIIKIQK